MAPLEVITAATKTGAEFFGVADRIGTIQPGKLADLVLIDGDPSARIKDIDNVSRVMLNGNWVPLPRHGDSLESPHR
jgi:imidazolonepropionase-like amidohydrolase